ncbi:Uncharacterized protein dnm_017770 [Desulfonema magnum]|uniref:Lipoprotein n=2 Tax=Desulfonema magnum TaxID=45655 RepID=A0A975BI54_9BACT|nr:Uncharacterized protein dnm_017770 [Desulfonema magnum]
MNPSRFLFIVFVFMLVAGCRSFVPFTYEQGKEFKNYLPNIQFYISQQILLQRGVESEEKIITSDSRKIRVEKNRKIMEIKIPKHTPGICRKTDGDELNKLYIQFEPPSENKERLIPFNKISKYDPVTDDPGAYMYQFKDREIIYEGKKYTVLFSQKKTRVSKGDTDIYANKTDETTQNHYFIKILYPLLIIDPVEHSSRFEKERRTVSGVKIQTRKDREEQGIFSNFFKKLSEYLFGGK